MFRPATCSSAGSRLQFTIFFSEIAVSSQINRCVSTPLACIIRFIIQFDSLGSHLRDGVSSVGDGDQFLVVPLHSSVVDILLSVVSAKW